MNITKENINNLTGLWKLVGKKINAFYSENGIEYCKIKFSDWPNRLWFLENISSDNLQLAKDIIKESDTELKLAYWSDTKEESNNIFGKEGFKPVSKQVGMSVDLHQQYKASSKISLCKVHDKTTANLWSQLFYSSFGYEINSDLVLLSCNEVKYYIAYHDQRLVGTCILFHQTNEVVGIHSLGIIPEQRRQGYAEDIMRILLNKSIDNKFQFVTLQASPMATHMYDKLGFTTQFIMTNYQIKK